jgi:LysM domain
VSRAISAVQVIRGLGIGVIVFSASVALSACASSSPTPPVRASGGTGAVAAKPAAVTGVVGTGTFSSPDGATSGSVTITAASGDFYLSLSNFATTEQGTLELSFSPYSAATPCLGDQFNLSFGNSSKAATQDNLALGPEEGDPSFYKTVVLERSPSQTSTTATGGCVLAPLAFATVKWTIPDTRPALKIVDAGSRPLASGTVTTDNGTPTSYLVMPGDQLTTIAKRLGITVDDIRFLNPFDTIGLEAGQRLNLSKALRDSVN